MVYRYTSNKNVYDRFNKPCDRLTISIDVHQKNQSIVSAKQNLYWYVFSYRYSSLFDNILVLDQKIVSTYIYNVVFVLIYINYLPINVFDYWHTQTSCKEHTNRSFHISKGRWPKILRAIDIPPNNYNHQLDTRCENHLHRLVVSVIYQNLCRK